MPVSDGWRADRERLGNREPQRDGGHCSASGLLAKLGGRRGGRKVEARTRFSEWSTGPFSARLPEALFDEGATSRG